MTVSTAAAIDPAGRAADAGTIPDAAARGTHASALDRLPSSGAAAGPMPPAGRKRDGAKR